MQLAERTPSLPAAEVLAYIDRLIAVLPASAASIDRISTELCRIGDQQASPDARSIAYHLAAEWARRGQAMAAEEAEVAHQERAHWGTASAQPRINRSIMDSKPPAMSDAQWADARIAYMEQLLSA